MTPNTSIPAFDSGYVNPSAACTTSLQLRTDSFSPRSEEAFYPEVQLTELPRHMLIQIFRCLSLNQLLVSATVCKLFKDVVTECLSFVSSLNLSGYEGSVTLAAINWAAHCSHLQNCRSLAASGSICKVALPLFLTTENGRAMFSKLESLTVDSCKQLDDSWVNKVLQATPNLVSLNLSHSTKLTDASARSIVAHTPKIQQLVCVDWQWLTDEGVQQLARGLPDLQHIVLDGCLRLTSAAMMALGQYSGNLASISTAKCCKIGDLGVEALGNCQKLRHVSLRQCPRVGRVSALSKCTLLESLDLSGCARVTQEPFRQLLQAIGVSLRKLVLYGTVGLAGEAMKDIGVHCPVLEVLYVRGLALRDEHLTQMAAVCSGKLRSLGVVWCTKVTDTGMQRLLQANPLLEELSLEGLYLVTDSVLEAAAQHTPLLASLNVRVCNNLTQRGLVECVRATRVRALHLSGVMDEQDTLALLPAVKAVRPDCVFHW